MARPRFELTRVLGTRVSDEELLADLRRVAIEPGIQTALQRRYLPIGLYDYSTAIRRFGS